MRSPVGEASGVLFDGWNNAHPFFLVLGTSRSGTSLVTAVLDAHSELTLGSEQFRSEILLGHSEEWSVRPRSERLSGFVAALQNKARKNSLTKWGNKITTEVVFHGAGEVQLPRSEAIADLLDRMPRIPIVYILRDGRSVVRSKMHRAGDTLEKSCRHWVLSIEIWEALLVAGWPMTTVRFEGLVRAPEQTVRSLCDDLGLWFEPGMLHSTSSDLLLPEYRRVGFDADAAAEKSLEAEGMRLIGGHLERAGYV